MVINDRAEWTLWDAQNRPGKQTKENQNGNVCFSCQIYTPLWMVRTYRTNKGRRFLDILSYGLALVMTDLKHLLNLFLHSSLSTEHNELLTRGHKRLGKSNNPVNWMKSRKNYTVAAAQKNHLGTEILVLLTNWFHQPESAIKLMYSIEMNPDRPAMVL